MIRSRCGCVVCEDAALMEGVRREVSLGPKEEGAGPAPD